MKMIELKTYTYIVCCADNTLYTGWTTDLKERIRVHNEGKGAKYTRSRKPVRLVYYEVFENKRDAMRREYAIKQLSRLEKLQLIENWKTACKSHFILENASEGTS